MREKITDAASLPMRVPTLAQLLGLRCGIPRAEARAEILRMIDEGALVVGDDYLVRARNEAA